MKGIKDSIDFLGDCNFQNPIINATIFYNCGFGYSYVLEE